MEYKNEKRICQNCKNDFTIESDDFNFYEKMKVPPPTFCPWCRFVRRMAWRNERVLYKRKCDLCNKNIIAMYHESTPFPVYCRECWFGDNWNPLSYGRNYDFSKPFFAQYKEFSNTVPRLALWQRNSINSDYSNMVGESKNVYLSTSVILGSENVFYSNNVDKSFDIVDCLNIKEGQSLYEDIEGEKNYNCQHLLLSKNCIDSYFLVDCVNCSNCTLSHNLRNKEFYIRNQKYTKDEYFKELEKLNFKSRVSREFLLKEFADIKEKAIYRFANIIRSPNSTGNNLLDAKNCRNCFDVYNVENLKYCYRTLNSVKDSMDMGFAIKSELIYEYTTGARGCYDLRFSYSAMDAVRNADYTESCRNSNNLFGCISLNNVENAILNKIYPKDEYKKLREKIIKQMEQIPFIDKKERVYKYGEYFPVELSHLAYNETLAQEFEPLTKEETEKKGYSWHEQSEKIFNITIPVDAIKDNIDDIDDGILKEVLGCAHKGNCDHQCNVAFRLANYEFQFYKKHEIPLPVLCPNCRYHERYKVKPALKLWKRSCMCDRKNHSHGAGKCEAEFETPYAPDRPEIVYCEDCYNKEIY